LPLCRRLATLLGGEVFVESEPGVGSTFYARVRIRYREEPPEAVREERGRVSIPTEGPWILIVEDEEPTRLLYEKYLKGTPYSPVAVPSLAAAREILARHRPAAVILDILLPGEEQQTWRWLNEVKSRDDAMPVIVVSQTGDARKALSLGADAYFDKPIGRDQLLGCLERLAGADAPSRVALIIDDDEAARYVIRRSVRAPMKFEEAADGESGLAAASRSKPGVIFLDLAMPGMKGDEVLKRLKADPNTADIPVVVVTSHDLDDGQRAGLSDARAIVQKKDLSVETLQRALDSIERGRLRR
jgi:CheY-like chemotaxis protein